MTDREDRPREALGQPPDDDPHVPDPDDADFADFAEEHKDVTFADDRPGGPEGVPEDDSPEGLAGED